MNYQTKLGKLLGTSLILASTTATVPGCYTIRTIPIKQEVDYPLRHVCQENSVCVDLYDNRAKCKAIFNNALIARGDMPVLLVIRNKSTNTYHILRDNVIFTDSQSQKWEQTDGRQVSKDFHRIPGLEGAIMAAGFGAAAGIGAILAADSWNKSMDNDYANIKQLEPDRAVYPEAVVSGIIYFKVPGKAPALTGFGDRDIARFVDGANLHIPLFNATQNSTEQIDIKLRPD